MSDPVPAPGAADATWLQERILAMDDGAFERTLAAWRRCERRLRQREHPEGYYDANHHWMPSPAERTDIVRQARGPTAESPEAYRLACRRLDHCAALEGAVYADALLVKYWVQELEARRVPPTDASAYRSSVQLQRLLDQEMASPAPRPRLRL